MQLGPFRVGPPQNIREEVIFLKKMIFVTPEGARARARTALSCRLRQPHS